MLHRFLLLLLVFASVGWAADRKVVVLDASNRPNGLVAGDNALLGEGSNLVVGTATGTKLGTSALQKLGAYGATPIVQPTGNALTALSNLGWIATPTLAASDISSGTLAVARGGTGLASYAIGDLLYADGATSLAKLADVATGNALISGGVTTAPSWGKIGLTTHVSGTLPIANGGTNSGTALSGSSIMVSNGSAIIQGSAGTSTTVLHGNASGVPTYAAVSLTADVSGILPSANGGTGVNNAGTITNASNTTITGGGTIALGGFTLTVPATGTAALLATANAFTAAQTITASNALTVQAAATQDAMRLAGRAGGTSSYIGTLTPTTLTASRTWTFPDSDTTIAGLAVAQTFTAVNTYSSATNSSSKSTGAIVISSGGIGVNNNVWAGNGIISDKRILAVATGTDSATGIIEIAAGTSPLSGVFQMGIRSVITSTSSATSGTIGQLGIANTAASAYTCGWVTGGDFLVQTIGAGSTATRASGFGAGVPTGGTNNAGIVILSNSNATAGTPTWTGNYALYNETSSPVYLGTGQTTAAGTTDSTSTSTGDFLGLGGAGFAKQVSARNFLATGGTITADKPAFDSTVTWNAGGVTFTGIKLNVTDTASASASLLIDLQVASTSKFNVSKAGKVTVTNTDQTDVAFATTGTAAIGAGVTDGYVGAFGLNPAYSGAFTVTRHNYISCNNPSLSSTTLTDACLVRFNAAAGTHKAVDSGTTKTTPGGVDAWIKININGTIYYMPAFTSKTS